MQETILTFKPSIKSIAFGLVGTTMFGVLANLMLTSKWSVAEGTDESTANVIMWVLTLVFVFFCSASFISVLNSKLIKLNNTELRIVKPFMFLHKSIFLSDIKRISQKKYNINSAHGNSNINVYNGLKILIELKNGKKIELNSFETTDYNKLNRELKKLISSHNSQEIELEDVATKDKWNGVGWLIFAILIAATIIWAFALN